MNFFGNYVIADKLGWPIERIISKNKFRNFIHFVNYVIRCAIHGRKIRKWIESEAPSTEVGVYKNSL